MNIEVNRIGSDSIRIEMANLQERPFFQQQVIVSLEDGEKLMTLLGQTCQEIRRVKSVGQHPLKD